MHPVVHYQIFELVGSQLSDFIRPPEKIVDLVMTNWMHVPIVQIVSKPKIKGHLYPSVTYGYA